MPLSNRHRGLALSMAAAALHACFLVPYKLALGQTPVPQALTALLFFAALFNSSAILVNLWRERRRGSASPAPRGASASLTVRVILGLAACSIVGNAALGQAVEGVTAAVVAVLLQTQVLFVALAARVWLGERFDARFGMGAAIAIGGVALMQLDPHGVRASLAGTLWGLLSAASFGMMQVITRKYIARIRPVRVNAGRLWLSVGLLAFLPGNLRETWNLPTESLALIALSAFAGPFVARVCLLYSARYTPAALTTLVGMSSTLFALLLGWLVLTEWPREAQLWGGSVVLLGMVVALGPRARPQETLEPT